RRLDVRDPIADGLACRLLQRAGAEFDRDDLCAEQAHPLDVGPLPAHVLLAHVDRALEPEAGADSRGRNSMLARACFGDDAALAEPAREDGLPERVVQLVRTGVEEVFSLQVETPARCEALGGG